MALSLSWSKCGALARDMRRRNPKCEVAFGIPMGGIAAAGLTGMRIADLDDPTPERLLYAYGDSLLVVDDLIDSGRTMQPYRDAGLKCDTLVKKPGHEWSEAPTHDGWIHFPWEREAAPEDAVVRLLQWIGEDPDREGLRDTPKRVVKAMREMTSGLHEDPVAVLGTVFNEKCDEMVIVRGLRYSSMCEHHLLPFTGIATIGYIPDGRIIGLSKIPRLLDVFARRPQVQERLTEQIADTLMESLRPQGVGVVLTGSHSCMGCRGAKQPDGEMITSAMRGLMRDNVAARSELLGLHSR